jgi:HD-like signal output (HDOD) protein
LIYDHPGLWSLSELDRSLTPGSATRLAEEPSRHATEDAVQRLYAAGLIHRCGQFVFASRAAHVADRVNA